MKYMQPAIDLAKKYNVSNYLLECLELTEMHIQSIFGKEKDKQEALGKWFQYRTVYIIFLLVVFMKQRYILGVGAIVGAYASAVRINFTQVVQGMREADRIVLDANNSAEVRRAVKGYGER